jgi:L-ascorbate metabolism protein UlaG (beta-lactamase superfamily)
MKRVIGTVIFALIISTSSYAAEPKLKWLGHAAFQYSSREGKIFLVDPWLSNPKAPKTPNFSHVEGILITHGHQDHVGEAFALSKKFNAPIVASHELTEIAKKHGVTNVIPLNPNGSTKINTVTITAVPAVHSSSYKDGENVLYAGAPLGFVIADEGAPTFYHAGDTGVFSDMTLIAELYNPQIALLPIGGIYTMKPAEAAIAARSMQLRTVVPMHYGTFPALAGTPEELKREMKRLGVLARVEAMTPGQELSLKDLAAVK